MTTPTTPAQARELAKEAWNGVRQNQQARALESLAQQVEALTADIAAEREACAKVCNSMVDLRGANDDHKYMADKCAAAIRARSQQTGALS